MKTTNPSKKTKLEATPECEVILLAIDAHLNKYVVRRQIDGQSPQPAQTFRNVENLLSWATRQTQLAASVYSVYEAGPLGFCLHRQLVEAGITNYVIRPKILREEGSRKRKSDRLDTLVLVRDLDRYVRGNRLALCVVRVPTLEEQLPRTQTRILRGLKGNRQSLESQGRGHLLYYGYHFKGAWWKENTWRKEVTPTVHEWLVEKLEPIRRLILETQKEIDTITREIRQQTAAELPRGLGQLTAGILDREVVDWNRFQRPRQISSYTGLCPGEHSSGEREQKLSITKEGNPQLRHVLVELAWRLLMFQPDYHAVKKYYGRIRKGLLNTSSARKRAIVALARQFAVDWWKIRTGRAKPEDFGLVMQAHPQPS